MAHSPKEILVIRRDNIGDLLCTTPLLRGLRTHFPGARITVLVNTYNAPVLHGNPDVDHVLAYAKAKHRDRNRSWWHWLQSRIQLLLTLRRHAFDVAIIASLSHGSALKFARQTRAKQILGYDLPPGDTRYRSMPRSAATGHEVEDVYRLLTQLDIHDTPPPMRLLPDARLAGELLAKAGGEAIHGLRIGLHISARKVKQRWPIERFAALGQQLLAAGVRELAVFWSPGAEDDPHHPGDDFKAAQLAEALKGLPVRCIPTDRLEELIAAMSLCDRVVCADGGAMHVAAALGKPIVCLFGNSDAAHWHPWGVPHEVLQTAGRDVNEISVEQAFSAWQALETRIGRSA